MEGPTHRYMESSPGCWAVFGEVLAREYSDPTYAEIHRLTVDSYAVQHPGKPSPQTIKSIGIHLIRLCLLVEQGLEMKDANAAMLAIGRAKGNFSWLEPPPSMGPITVREVCNAPDPATHKITVKLWAASTWEAWASHHATVRTWIPPELERSRSGTSLISNARKHSRSSR